MSNTNSVEDKELKYLYYLADNFSDNYKRNEGLAYRTFIFMVAILGGLLTALLYDNQIIKWKLAPTVTWFGFFGIWCITHVFIRHQLRLARASAIGQKAVIRAIKERLQNNVRKSGDNCFCKLINKVFSVSPRNNTNATCCCKFIDKFLIPLPWIRVNNDISNLLEKFSSNKKSFETLIKEEWKKGSRTAYTEYFLTIGSLAVAFIACHSMELRLIKSLNDINEMECIDYWITGFIIFIIISFVATLGFLLCNWCREK